MPGIGSRVATQGRSHRRDEPIAGKRFDHRRRSCVIGLNPENRNHTSIIRGRKVVWGSRISSGTIGAMVQNCGVRYSAIDRATKAGIATSCVSGESNLIP
jgi:hypothetical protein